MNESSLTDDAYALDTSGWPAIWTCPDCGQVIRGVRVAAARKRVSAHAAECFGAARSGVDY